jgi:hypothetical protein
VDKQRLTTLINQPEKLEENDFRDLNNLKKEFPYFQALSPLITIGSKKYSPQREKKLLQTSAIYALDRKHLKEILTNSFDSAVSNVQQKESEESTVKNKIVEAPLRDNKNLVRKTEAVSDSKIESASSSDSSHLPDSFFEELFRDMAALKEEKEKYQKTLERIETKKPAQKSNTATAKKTSTKTTTKKPTSSKTSSAKKTTAKAASTKKTSTTKKTTSSKANPKKTTATKAKSSTKKTPVSKTKKTNKPTSRKSKKDEHDIIEEITSRKELKISDAHKKEQLDIINNFIQKEPVLTKRIDPDNQANKQEAEDLSANSTNLSDDVVSETLAKLMIKQGRKQKAIDIYKKLIWKFPQKKTYFVEIIDELKKES